MRSRTLALTFCLFLALVLVWGAPSAEAQGEATHQPAAPQQSETLQNVEQRLGVPLHVDWMQGRLTPGQRCFEHTGHGLRESGCEVPIEAQRVASDQELTFVRLFTEASEGMGIPRHVVLRKDSQVEILGAKVRMSWDQSRDVIMFGVDDQDPWLKVRIDGQEGWIHTQEDFTAVGLPQTG